MDSNSTKIITKLRILILSMVNLFHINIQYSFNNTPYIFSNDKKVKIHKVNAVLVALDFLHYLNLFN